MQKPNLIILTTACLFSLAKKPAVALITNPVLPNNNLGQGNPEEGLALMIANIWKSFVVIGGLFFVIYFAWGAVRWLTAQGDKGKFEEGQNKIANGLIGLVILVSSVAIIQFLGDILDIPFLQTLNFTLPTP
jgi:hypothetical protein